MNNIHEYTKGMSPDTLKVFERDYGRLAPLLCEIDKRAKSGAVTVAIDGRCASGKTTLSGILSEIYDCNVFRMDDFFLPFDMRTEKRLSEPGGNIHRERFLAEVLRPLSEGRTVLYRRFDCHGGVLEEPLPIPPKGINIIEGVYSLHPELAPYADIKVFLWVSPEVQRERILLRSTPELAEKFFNLWIPLEEKYFDYYAVMKAADIILK